MKQNDWIVANINNPEFNVEDFKNILGLTVDNTQLLPMESYLKSKFITENDLFKNLDGSFNLSKFEKFYKTLASKFSDFSQESAIDNYEFGFWDIRQKPDSKVLDINFNLELVSNPEHISMGVVGPNMLGERTKSDFELAEKQKIYNWKEGKYEDLTPEDYGLFTNPIRFINNLFSDPLVLAEYELDEIDPITGELHYKGDKKLNDNGEYYFETLGNRSVIGKKILSIGDTLTKEDSLINKYNFFDSDDLEKSVSGVIAKNLVAIAPMAVLGPYGQLAYSGLYVAREIAKSLPMLNNILHMFGEDNEDPKWLNTVAALGEKFTGGTSNYAKANTFSFENFGNLIADVALQWGQLKLIVNSISRIKGSTNAIIEGAEAKAALEYEKRALEIWNRATNGEIIEALQYTGATSFDNIKDVVASGAWKSTSVGAAAMQKFVPEAQKAFSKRALLGMDMSLIYMAMISNYDVYNDAIEHGATKSEAAAIALGSTIGMFVVDKYAHLGEIFFDETPEKMALRNLRQGILDEASELTKKIGTKEAKDESQKGLISLMKKSADKVSNFVKNYLYGLKNHTLGFFGKAFGEGLEEMSEEAVTDMAKSLYELGGQFGYFTQSDVGAWDNMKERYLMSLFGGAIGGGLYYGVNAISNPKSTADLSIQKEMLYLVSQEKTTDILNKLKDLKDKGKLSSTSLSIDTVDDENGNKVFLTADENHKSLNDFVYEIMRDAILQMDSIINEHGLKLNDDLLFEKMVLGHLRYMALKNNLFNKSYITQYYDDFQQIVSDIYNIEKEILDLKDSTKDEDKREENSNYLLKLKDLEALKKELVKLKEAFLKGEYNLDYVDKMLFYIHPEVNSAFYSSLYEQWVLEKYHKDIRDLSEGELKKYSEEWIKLKKSLGKQLLNLAFNAYKAVRTNIESGLQEVGSESLLELGELLKQLLETSPENQELKWEDIIPSTLIDIEDVLDDLGVIKTSEYDKPWRNDPTKVNKAFQLLLEEDSSAGFELVKDLEDGYWSIHFKTPRTLSIELKLRLFRAAAVVIPEGDKLSTWGELTKGGISGINRFGLLEYLGGIEFEQVGTRQVYQRNTYSGLSVEELKNALEELKSFIGSDTELDRNLYYNIEQINSELEKQGEEGFNLSGYTQSTKESTNYVSEVEIPIWLKTVTGDTEEDYNDRNTQREGESEKDFANRKKARENKLKEYNKNNFLLFIKKFVDANDIIDRSSFRRIVASLRIRRQDYLKDLISKSLNKGKYKTFGLVTASSKREFSDTLFDSLKHLHPDFSNRDDVNDEIISKTKKLRTEEFDKINLHRYVSIDTSKIPAGINIEGPVTFDFVIDAVSDAAENHKVSLASNLTPEQVSEGYITYDLLLDNLYLRLDKGESVLFKLALENAIKINNMILDGVDSEDNAIKSIKDSMESLNYKEFTSTGEYIPTDLLFLDEYDQSFLKEETVNALNRLLKYEIDKLIDELERNNTLRTINELHKKATLDLSPVIKVLKSVLPKLGEDFGDILETLETIYNQYDSLEVPTSFTLTPKLLAALKKAQNYFGYILAVVRSAKTKSSYFDYLPYNNSLNSFIEDNKDIIKNVEKLLEIDEDLANVLEESFKHFDLEILAWILKSEKGTINKREMFSKFDLRFNKARLDFFNQIKDLCKVNEKDLFKGFEHINVDRPDAIVEIEKLIYNNFKELGWNESDLVSIIKKLIKLENIIKLDSGIGKSLDLDFVFTDYDKFILLTSLVSADPIDFYNFYKTYVQNSTGKEGLKLAPLTFLEYNIKLGYIHKNSMPFINKLLEEFAKQSGMKGVVLKNVVVISGIAGVGKTDVVIRALQDSESVWVSGPSDTLIDGLRKIIPHAEPLGHKELFNKIMGPELYSDILSEIKEVTSKKLENENNAYNGKYIKSEAKNEYATLKLDNIKFITKDAPKLLVIDEITLYSNIELLLLSEWANKTGTLLIFAGDGHLNGDKSLGFNIKPDYIFTFRTPEMTIPLRDANIWKYKNQQEIVSQINDLEEYKNAKLTKKYLSKFNFHYYLNDDKFAGELVTEELLDSVIKNLNGTIAFVGDISSKSYLQLKGLGKTIEVFDSVDSILGKEFDYVVADIDLEYKPVKGYTEFYNLQTYLNTLYTLITRSKNGTVLIDNGLTKTILGSKLEQYSNDNIGITPEITEKYVEDKLNFLNSLDLNRKVPIEPLEEPLTEETIIEGEEYEEPVKEEEEEEPETEDYSYLDIEALLETIIPVFGNINLSGLEKNPTNGKLKKVGNRDLGIFLKDGLEIDIKDRPKKSLFQLKSLILFDKLTESWYNELTPLIRNLFTLEDLLKIKYYVSAEDYNPETHKLLTKEAGYENDKLAFSVNGVKKLFTLIGVIEKDGKQYEITLGGLSNPATLRKNLVETIKLIKKRAASTTNTELKEKLEKYADTYEDKVNYYENLLIKLTQAGRWQIKKPSFDRCTRISRMKNEDGTRKYYPLNEYFDINTELYVVSPVFTQVNRADGKDEILPGLDDKYKGKPVIFVSAFNLYNPMDLDRIYAEQKTNPERNYPEVRKIILDPRGVTFGDLVNFKIVGMLNSDEIIFPFSNTSVAFKMYMSLWNFRAKITNFNEKVKEYIEKNNLSINTILLLAIEESENPGSTDEKFKPLHDLNKYLDEQGVLLFRLGYSSENGFYSRKINDSVNGTFINYLMALDYLKVIDLLFKNVLDKMITPPNATTVKSIMGKTSDFDKLVAIDTWVRKLGSNREVNLSFKTDDSDETIPFKVTNVELFKSLPAVLVLIERNLEQAQLFSTGVKGFKQKLEDDPNMLSWWYIRIKDDSGESEDLDYLSIGDGLTGGLLDSLVSGTAVLSPGIRYYNEKAKEGSHDLRIMNLFELAFHGRVGEGLPADGTLLKHGIFADTFTVGKYDAYRAFKVVSTNRGLYRTNAMPSSPVLKIDISKFTEEASVEELVNLEKETDLELNRVNTLLGTSFTDRALIPIYINNNLNSIFENSVSLRELLKKPIKYIENNGIYTFKTLKDIIKDELGFEITKVTPTKDSSGVTYSFINNGEEYTISLIDNDVHINKPNKTINKIEDFILELNNIDLSVIDNLRTQLEDNDADVNDFDIYFQTLRTSQNLKLDDIKSTYGEMMQYLKENGIRSPELSELQNKLNKINCING